MQFQTGMKCLTLLIAPVIWVNEAYDSVNRMYIPSKLWFDWSLKWSGGIHTN